MYCWRAFFQKIRHERSSGIFSLSNVKNFCFQLSSMSNLQTTVHYRKAPSMTVWHLSFCRIIFVPQISLLKTSQSHGHSLLPKACAPYLSLLSHAEVTSQAQEISVTRRNLETRHPLRPDPRADTFPERNN